MTAGTIRDWAGARATEATDKIADAPGDGERLAFIVEGDSRRPVGDTMTAMTTPQNATTWRHLDDQLTLAQIEELAVPGDENIPTDSSALSETPVCVGIVAASLGSWQPPGRVA